jgi:hypothetical protein
MADTFWITLQANQTLPALVYWFMDDDDPEYLHKIKVQPLKAATATTRLDIMDRRLNARCKGLLEVQGPCAPASSPSSVNSGCPVGDFGTRLQASFLTNTNSDGHNRQGFTANNITIDDSKIETSSNKCSNIKGPSSVVLDELEQPLSLNCLCNWQVDYLRRTVRDFLQDAEV